MESVSRCNGRWKIFRNIYFAMKYCDILSWLSAAVLLSTFHPDLFSCCWISIGAQIVSPIFLPNLDLLLNRHGCPNNEPDLLPNFLVLEMFSFFSKNCSSYQITYSLCCVSNIYLVAHPLQWGWIFAKCIALHTK